MRTIVFVASITTVFLSTDKHLGSVRLLYVDSIGVDGKERWLGSNAIFAETGTPLWATNESIGQCSEATFKVEGWDPPATVQ